MPAANEETLYRLMKAIAANPQASQRDLAREMGVSLGKVNYCLKGLVEKGMVEAHNFLNIVVSAFVPQLGVLFPWLAFT